MAWLRSSTAHSGGAGGITGCVYFDVLPDGPPAETQAQFALGNWGSPEAVPALAIALNDEEPLVRGHAARALGRIGTKAARQGLRGSEEAEEDAWVREAICAALTAARERPVV